MQNIPHLFKPPNPTYAGQVLYGVDVKMSFVEMIYPMGL